MKRWAKLPPALRFAIGLVLLAVICYFDVCLGPQMSMSVFYLIPIGYICWYGGDVWGYAMALIASIAWLGQDLIVKGMGNNSLRIVRMHSLGFQYWNTFIRLGFFAIVAGLTNSTIRLRRLYDAEHEVSELKSNLVSLVSHEFGNMLTIFRLGLTFLRESDEAEPPAARLQHYAMLERVYANLSSNVANFLNLNRIESGRFVPHIGRTSLRAQVHAMIALLDPICASKHISLTITMPPGPLLVAADPDALMVVLSNLIGNAFKYTPDGGSVTVSVVREPPDTALVVIQDTGMGIPQKDLPLIASGYYRAEGGRQAAKGYGIGLKVVRDLLETHRSCLEVDSTPGHGSRFSFRLPLWRGQIPPTNREPTTLD